jgi:ABC-type sugar transport system ATPase subunit
LLIMHQRGLMSYIKFLIILMLVTPVSAEALTAKEVKLVWYKYVAKLKDTGIACIYTKAELADMFTKMDASFPKAEPGKVFVADRNQIKKADETEMDKLIPTSYKDQFFADERTNTRVSERDQVKRKMKMLALEALNEVRSPVVIVPDVVTEP